MALSDESTRREQLNLTLLAESDFVLKEPVDLTNCEKEPIHNPGLIQPHGILLALTNDSEMQIVQCSSNVQDMLGIPTEELLGQSLSLLLEETERKQLLEAGGSVPESIKLHYQDMTVTTSRGPLDVTGTLHESEGLLVLELEPRQAEAHPATSDFEWIQSFFGRIKQADNRIEASQITAGQLKDMLGYDRVMIYEFDEHWNGTIIAESMAEGLEPFLGHCYPASDIPQQTRELCLRNWLRIIVDVHYQAVPIMPSLHPLTGRPLNLSLSRLRSVSPVHIEYLQNMGVSATMTISLIRNNSLWGLITCHHYSPKYVSHRMRNICNFIGSFFSSELYQRQQVDEYENELQLKSKAGILASIFIGNSTASEVFEQLTDEQDMLLSLMNAGGAAVRYQEQWQTFGVTPRLEQIQVLADWATEHSHDYVYHSSHLSRDYEPAAAYTDSASGILFLALSQAARDLIIWFRPERIQEVSWAGDPGKAVIQSEDGVRMSPRKSFEKWQQVVKHTSSPWSVTELRLLPDLRVIVQKRTEKKLRHAEEEARQQSRVLQEKEKRYLQFMDASPVAFLTVCDGIIVYCNWAAAQLFRADHAEALTGSPFNRFILEKSQPAMHHRLERLLQERLPLLSTREEFIGLDDHPLKLELTIAQVSYGGKPAFMAITREEQARVLQDSSYRDMADQLQRYIHTDTLTEMPNRRFFEESLAEKWSQGVQEGSSVSIVLIDIDNFKAYNTYYGIHGGDLCLQSVGDALLTVSQMNEIVTSRYGGAEFAVVLKGASPERTAVIAEQIRSMIESLQIPHMQNDHADYLTASIGVSSMRPSKEKRPVELLDRSRMALNQAKQEGKNRVVSI